MAHSAYRMARFAYPNSAVRFTFEPCTTPKPTPLPVRHRRLRPLRSRGAIQPRVTWQIEILFCGICHSDLHQVRNEWSGVMPTVYPCVPGHEIVGRVTKVGRR
jgi:threonine dehydrogenase-like Zn-dependent dehydrogenase